MKVFLLVLLFCCSLYSYSQNNFPKIEVSASPGFFFEHLNNDSLIPEKRRGASRLGDVAAFNAQLAFPLKNERWIFKAGLGFSQRHYSLNKYSLDDFFIAIFSFDSPPRRDSFNISYVRFTNNYLQVPLSAAYVLNKNGKNFKSTIGLNIKGDFLLKSNADVRFDSTYKIPQQGDIKNAQKMYTQNANNLVITIEPYWEASFKIYKNAGGFFQTRPFSLYTSKLNKQFTSSTFELFSFTFGLYYSLK